MQQNTYCVPVGTILFHERKQRFANGLDCPYAPCNWFSKDKRFYFKEEEDTKSDMNTYMYRVKKEIKNVVLMSDQFPYTELETIISSISPKTDTSDMHEKVQFLESIGFHGVVDDIHLWTQDHLQKYALKHPTSSVESKLDYYRVPYTISSDNNVVVSPRVDNEYRLPFQVVRDHLELIKSIIVDDTVALNENHTKWEY